ncbi:hypothetical protein [Roseomonas marmotae]|uniref:Outer membrane protein beta-barrel domain-containing protein n=1 Tax=Roseomonas marmotae TaxID=2768161 RepID=A0ABS3KFS7_9PROT|nr:hypothetical protein [Roseomonas marmotae]MBO1075498.1 hypothetical protein [Roseomonas marmotae]QTI81442.1 hypothetical protein IAI58_19035 [Roseomonas marmotae]
MKKLAGAALAVLSLGAAMPAQAQNPLSGVNLELGVTGGTLGIGPELNIKPQSWPLGLRLNYTTFDFDRDFSVNGVNYNGTLDLSSFGATLDFYPFRTGFRVSAGLRYSDDSVDLTGHTERNFRYKGTTIAGSDLGTLYGDVTYNKIKPYLGLGYTYAFLGGRLPVSLDVGATYLGNPDVNLRADAGAPAIAAAYVESKRHDLERKMDNYKFYPVIQLSIAYRF